MKSCCICFLYFFYDQWSSNYDLCLQIKIYWRWLWWDMPLKLEHSARRNYRSARATKRDTVAQNKQTKKDLLENIYYLFVLNWFCAVMAKLTTTENTVHIGYETKLFTFRFIIESASAHYNKVSINLVF